MRGGTGPGKSTKTEIIAAIRNKQKKTEILANTPLWLGEEKLLANEKGREFGETGE